MMYKSTDHGRDVDILFHDGCCVCYILKHLKDKKLRSVHIYYMGMTSFSFTNCTEELSFASFFYTQFENSNDVILM